MSQETDVVIGGGIGGLSAAIAMLSVGRSVKVFEKSHHPSQGGAALALGANAVEALNRLGLGEAVAQRGHVIDQFDILDHRGMPIFGYETPEALRHRPGVAILREDLHHTLRDALPAGVLSLGRNLVDIRTVHRGVRARFEDGEDVLSPLVIGADGIRSRVRLAIYPKVKPRHAGYVCWRGLTAAAVPGVDPHRATETWTAKGRFGLVPLAGGRVYWFACLTAQVQDRVLHLWDLADLKRHFGHFHDPIPDVLEATQAETIHMAEICDLPLPRRFHVGRAVLLGDAAHGTTPNLGQGACQAVEDALVLSMCLKEHKSVDRALAAYNARRRPRAGFITRASRRVGVMAQMRSPLLIKVRNFILKKVPPAVWRRMTRKVLMPHF